MNQNTHPLSEPRQPVLSGQNELFTAIQPAASSQISGGYWQNYSTSVPAPSHSHGYGRIPSYSHQIAAQRLNQALFA